MMAKTALATPWVRPSKLLQRSKYMGRIIWYIEIQPSDKSKQIYLYLDNELRTREEKDFLVRISSKPEIIALVCFP